MLELGERAGREVVCLLTDMDQPLGRAVGNALEIREALATLRGRRAPRLHRARARRVCAPARALRPRHRRAGRPRARGGGGARRLGARACTSAGSRAQGGDPSEDALPRGAGRARGRARRSAGYVARSALHVGIAALQLGAGRRTKDDAIDHAVGVVCLRKRGDEVERGEPLAEVHARDRRRGSRAARRRRCSARTSSAAEPPAARGRSSLDVACLDACPSCPRSRPSAEPRAVLAGRTLRARRDPRRAADAPVRSAWSSPPSSKASASRPSSGAASISLFGSRPAVRS